MVILAIDTSSSACSIAIAIDDKIYSRHVIAPMQQAQMILPMIDELVNSIGMQLSDLNFIAFGQGPGSFTGIRIAASVTQGLAMALNIPIVGVSSLATLAQSAYDAKGWDHLLVGVDARLNEVYWAKYAVNDAGIVELQGQEMLSAPEQLILGDEEKNYYGVGSAWLSYSARIFCQPIDIDQNQLPEAKSMLTLAQLKITQGDFLRPEQALPVYLRERVAMKSNKR